MDELLGSSGGFNEWVMSPFVNVNESLAVTDFRTARRSYNKLKELVDPAPMRVTANPKYGTKVDVWCTTSFLFFSNHMDAVYLHAGDRRFFAAPGPDVPADADYFRDVYTWLEGGDWMQHIWWYLHGLDVDMAEMMQAPPNTTTMDDVRFEATSPLEAVVRGAIECWPTPMVPPSIIRDLLVKYVPRGVPENHKSVSQRMIGDMLRSLSRMPHVSRARGVRVSLKPEHARDMHDENFMVEAHHTTKLALETFDEDAFKQQIDDWLDEKGFEF